MGSKKQRTDRKRWLVGVLLVLLGLHAAGQRAGAQDITVQAYVQETTIGSNEQLTYTLEIEGVAFSDVETPEPPATENLALVQPFPAIQRNLSFVNGLQRQSVTFQWTYRPVRPGIARIDPVSVSVQGRRYRTDPIRVDVVPQQQRAGTPSAPGGQRRAQPNSRTTRSRANRITEEDIFIKAIPSARQAYQNEQITVEYRLYFRPYVQPRESRLADSWDAEGFWREELPVEGRPIPHPTTEKGLRYNAITLKRVAVFPTRSGELVIDPLRIETEVLALQTARDPFGRLFSTRHPFETVELASPSVRVEAKPLPPDPPDAFAGAVGRFDVTTTIEPRQVQVGEAVTVRMRVAGTGNLSLMEPPAFEVPGVFETYGPRTRTVIDSTSARVRGVRTFTYTLVPRSNGTYELPSIAFAYFDPVAERYRIARSEAATIRAEGTATVPAALSRTGAGLPVDDIGGLLSSVTWHPRQSMPLHRQVWPYLALVLPLLALVGVYAYRRHATRMDTDLAFARNRRAHPLARKHLRQAQALLDQDAPEAYYEELERAVLGFIGNRLNIAERGLTRPELDERLREVHIAPAQRQEVLDFLHTSDQVRFSPVRPATAQMQASFDQAQHLIISLDEAFTHASPSAL